MEAQRKISIVSLLIAILLIVTITIGTSYSLWTTSVQQETTNTIDVGCFRIEFSDEGIVGAGNISLDKAYPMTESMGKSLVPYKFNISNTCSTASSYNVILETLNTSTMDESKLDVYFNDTSVKNYASNVTEELSEDAKNGMKLFNGYLAAGDSVTYSLRVWIDYDVTVDTPNIQGKVWNGRIVVNSEATFTKPTFTNKVVGEDSVTLDIDTKNDKTVKTLECFYGNANVQSEVGTAVGKTQCQYPLTAEYAKYRVTYTDGSIDTSYVKKLVDYFIKDGTMIKAFEYSNNSNVSFNDGYVNMIVDNGGRGGLIFSNTMDFTKYAAVFVDCSYSVILSDVYPSFSLGIPVNGGSIIDKNDSSGSFSLNIMTYNQTEDFSVERNLYYKKMNLDDSYNATRMELLRNHSGDSALNANIYNIGFQLSE